MSFCEYAKTGKHIRRVTFLCKNGKLYKFIYIITKVHFIVKTVIQEAV